MISTWLSKETALFLGCLSTLGCSRRAPSAVLRLLTVVCITARNQTFASYLSLTLCPSTSRRSSLKKSLSPIMPCSRAYFVQGTKQSLPAGRPTACRIVDRSMDPEVLTVKGQLPHDETCRSLRTLFSVDSQLQSQAASETHAALCRPSWKGKLFLVAKNVHLVAMMRLVFGF